MSACPSRISSILAATGDGHALVDGQTTLLQGIPQEWVLKTEKMLLELPYDYEYMSKNGTDQERPRKKTKVDRILSANEQANLDSHGQLKRWLPSAVEFVRQKRLESGETTWCTFSNVTHFKETNRSATEQDLVAWAVEGAELRELDGGEDSEHDTVPTIVTLKDHDTEMPMLDLFNKVIMNANDTLQMIKTPAASYMLPGRSGFLMADMHRWYELLQPLRSHTFNLVLMDPPWRSKSVRRSGEYEEMDMYDLYEIRLPDLLSQSTDAHPVLVGVWVTNHAKCRRFVRDKLLPAWGITDIVDWYWVKISAGRSTNGQDLQETGGLPVWSFDGPDPRRCYEGLILGYLNPKAYKIEHSLPDKRAFLSVPLEHSRKPLITDLLSPFVQGANLRILELFSRFAAAGRSGCGSDASDATEDKEESKPLWVSVGNQALKFNDANVFWQKGVSPSCEGVGESAN